MNINESTPGDLEYRVYKLCLTEREKDSVSLDMDPESRSAGDKK